MFKKILKLMVAATAIITTSGMSQQPTHEDVADIAIIVNARNPAVISAGDAKNIFLGRITYYPIYETEVKPVMLQDDVLNRIFHVNFLGLPNTSRFKATWSKLLFTGQVKPPKLVGKTEEVIQQVASDEQAIGYVPLDQVTNDVKIAYVIRKG